MSEPNKHKAIPSPKLNARQARFAEFYAEGDSATGAYIAAGYAVKGADAGAARLLVNVRVAAYIAELRDEARSSTVATLREIAEFHTKCMRNDPRGFVVEADVETTLDADGEEVDRTTTYRVEVRDGAFVGALESVKYDAKTGRPTEVKCVSKSKAAEDLGKHLGYFERDNTQQKTAITIAVADLREAPMPESDKIE